MNQCKCILLLLLTVVSVKLVISKQSEASKFNLLVLYEVEIDLSVAVESSAHNLTKFVGQRLSQGQLKVLTDYRVRAAELKKATLKEANEHQNDGCTDNVARWVEEVMTSYVESETPCAKKAKAIVKEPRKRVKFSSREVKKWRQNLMFMGSTCEESNPDDRTSALQCLIQMVGAERYNTVITRLVVTLEEAENELLTTAEKALSQLEQCIEGKFIEFSGTLRRILTDIRMCRKEKEDVKTEANGNENHKPEPMMEPPRRPAQIMRQLGLKCLE